MYKEMEGEFQQFLIDMEEAENAMVFARYMDEYDYEDSYGNNEIYEYQEKYKEKVRDWLKENKPGKYIVAGGYNVSVMTLDEARKRLISEDRIEEMIAE